MEITKKDIIFWGIVISFLLVVLSIFYFAIEEAKETKKEKLEFCEGVGYENVRYVEQGFAPTLEYCYTVKNNKLEQVRFSEIKGEYYLE